MTLAGKELIIILCWNVSHYGQMRTKNKQENDLAISFLLLMITLSIFPKLMFG